MPSRLNMRLDASWSLGMGRFNVGSSTAVDSVPQEKANTTFAPPSDEMVRPRVHGPPQTAVLAHGFALTGQLGQASHFEADLCFPTDARKTRGSPHAVGMR
jgi:hypothetical protein